MGIEKTSNFKRMYEAHSDSIFRFCLFRVSNREQALDLTQETFLRLWQSLLENKNIKNEQAFLFTVARRLVIDWYRKKKSISLESIMYKEGEIEYELIDEITSGDNIELEAEGRHLLSKINDLTPASRDSVYMRFVEGFSPEEIGNILGITGNAASVRINRGLLELRRKTGYDNEKK